jgi:hypothetical protein
MIKTVVNYSKLYDQIYHNQNAQTVSFGISDRYVPLWTELEALTEYIANFYDENFTDFTISHTDKAVILEDNSKRGIKLEDLAFGNSRSADNEYLIGTHGEGFKLGALVLVRENRKVVIETIGNTMIFYLDEDQDLKSKILKSKIIPNERTTGSTIYLETNKLEIVKEKFLFLNTKLQKVNDNLFISEQKTNNYIFVNTLAGQKIDSMFSYALYKKQVVNRDRNMLESPYQEVLKVLLNSQDKEMLKVWLSSLVDVKDNTFEMEMIGYLMDNFKKKEFSNINLSLIQEIAKQENFLFLGCHGDKDKTPYEFLYPEHKVILSSNKSLESFFRKILNCEPIYFLQSNISVIKNNRYHIPMHLNSANYSDIALIEQFISILDRLKFSPKYKLEGNTIQFNLNQQDFNLVSGPD